MAKRSEWPKLAVYLLLERNDKVMLARRFNTGWHDGDFSLPAGHVNENESAMQSLIRETQEEVGVTIKRVDLELVHTIHRNKTADNSEYVDLYFKAREWKGEIQMGESIDKVEWFTLDKLPSNIIPVVASVLKEIAKGNLYSDQGWNK